MKYGIFRRNFAIESACRKDGEFMLNVIYLIVQVININKNLGICRLFAVLKQTDLIGVFSGVMKSELETIFTTMIKNQ